MWIELSICDSHLSSEPEYSLGLIKAEDIQVARPLKDGGTALTLKTHKHPVYVSESVEDIKNLLVSCNKVKL